MWRTDNSAGTWTRTSDAQQTGGSITAIAIATGDSNTVIDGAASGQIRRTAVGTTATSVSVLNATWLQSFTPRGNGFGGISWVEYAPTNKLIVYATVSNFNSAASGNGFGHVFKSTDGGATWALADGNQSVGNPNAIPDIPAHSIAIHYIDPNRVYVGTDLGIFVTTDGGANWFKESGFPNVVTESLSFNKVGPQLSLYAFTHGRGAFKIDLAPTAAPASISGRVTTPDGQPLAGVTMTLSGAKNGKAITDSNGNYRFSNVETDNFYTVTPSLVNYHFGPESQSFSLLANRTDAVFTATRDAVISGNPIDTADTSCGNTILISWDASRTKVGSTSGAIRYFAAAPMPACVSGARSTSRRPTSCRSSFRRPAGWLIDSIERVMDGAALCGVHA